MERGTSAQPFRHSARFARLVIKAQPAGFAAEIVLDLVRFAGSLG